jgi:hypothetical protein
MLFPTIRRPPEIARPEMSEQSGQSELPSERDLGLSLSLLVMCLARYFAGPARGKLIAWLEVQADQMKAQGFDDVHLSHIRALARVLRKDELKPFL